MRCALQDCVTEWSYSSGKAYQDPFNDVELDVLISRPDGQEQLVPAFWAGDHTWRVRYASPLAGTHHCRTVCSDQSNADLHGHESDLEVAPHDADNPLLHRGTLQVSGDHRHLEYGDGTPFFWLADTWWMGLCQRLRWPHEFRTLTADRVDKGFTVIQIVAGLYPDMPYLDQRGANEAGFPWEPEFTRIDPNYFDTADLRIAALVDAGLVPCILGSWGYFMMWMGVERLKKHWRNLIARYGAYPVVWCLAGEGVMPYYLSEDREGDIARQRHGWTEMAHYVRETDPWGRLITIHPTDTSRNQVDDPSALDFDMLQTGHGDRASIPNTVTKMVSAYAAEPRMPVLNSEVCYEGIMEGSREEVQRFMFWASMLSGACGHTYGANGVWQVNQPGQPYGPSPHGSSWGDRPWTQAYQLPGSHELGVARRLLQRYDWWRFEPHPEWVEPHWSQDNYHLPYAAGIPGEIIVIFMPTQLPPLVTQLEPGAAYQASYFNPSDGAELDLGPIQADQDGNWQAPKPPIFRDWVLVVELSG